MDQDIKELLQVNIELSRENNKMLKKVRKVQKRSALLTYLRWIVIIGLALGAYYYVQPYITKIIQAYNSIPNFGNLDIKNLEGIIKSLKP